MLKRMYVLFFTHQKLFLWKRSKVIVIHRMAFNTKFRLYKTRLSHCKGVLIILERI